MAEVRRSGFSFAVLPVFIAVLGCFSLSGCSSQPRAHTPASAARAKVSFLRREGARLNPYQVSLIHQIPYTANAHRLESRMTRVLSEGVADADQPDGYRVEKLSERLREKVETSSAEGTPENSGEDTDH